MVSSIQSSKLHNVAGGAYPYTHAHTHTYTYADTYTYAHTHTHSHTHSHTYPYADTCNESGAKWNANGNDYADACRNAG